MKDRVSILTELIYKNPGLHFSEIVRVSGLKNGVLSHYLKKLESAGQIHVRREEKTRFFDPNMSVEEINMIKFLRKETSKNILFTLNSNNGLHFKEIVKKVEKSPGTVSQNISKLIQNDLVLLKLENNDKKYFLKHNSSLKKLIQKFNFD